MTELAHVQPQLLQKPNCHVERGGREVSGMANRSNKRTWWAVGEWGNKDVATQRVKVTAEHCLVSPPKPELVEKNTQTRYKRASGEERREKRWTSQGSWKLLAGWQWFSDVGRCVSGFVSLRLCLNLSFERRGCQAAVGLVRSRQVLTSIRVRIMAYF